MVEEGSDPSDKEVIAKANREWDRRNFFALKILFNTSKFYENFHYFLLWKKIIKKEVDKK